MEHQTSTRFFAGRTVEGFLHHNDRYIEITYIGGITSLEEYQDVSLSALEIAKQHQIRKWLIDQVQMNIHPNALQWLFSEWVPRLVVEVGERRTTATIVAKNLFGEFATKQNITKNAMENASNVNAGFFKTREEALDWLLNDPSNATY